MQPRQKTLLIRKAVFAKGANNLEGLLRGAVKVCGTQSKRTFDIQDGERLQGTVTRPLRSGGVVIQLNTYVPKEKASVVKHVAANAPEGEIDTASPPAGADFMDREIFALVRENNVALCCSNAREGLLGTYFWYLIQAAKIVDGTPDVHLSPIADIRKTALIKKEGVKSIRLRASIQQVLAGDEDKAKNKIFRGMVSNLFDLFAADADELADDDDMRALVVFSVKKNASELAHKEIDSLALQLLDDDESEFMIETRQHSQIKSNEVKLQTLVRLPPKGKSVVREAAWDALSEFMDEVSEKGLVK